MRAKTMQSFAFAVKQEWLAQLDVTVAIAKDSNFAMQSPINRSEIARQAALIGFEVIQCLGSDFNGAGVTALLIQKKFNCNK